jgi:hypothetical protein
MAVETAPDYMDRAVFCKEFHADHVYIHRHAWELGLCVSDIQAYFATHSQPCGTDSWGVFRQRLGRYEVVVYRGICDPGTVDTILEVNDFDVGAEGGTTRRR